LFAEQLNEFISWLNPDLLQL